MEADLEKFVDEDASLVYHCNVEGAPVLEEGEVEELVIDGEIVVCDVVVWRCCLPCPRVGADARLGGWVSGLVVEGVRTGWRMRKRSEKQPDGRQKTADGEKERRYLSPKRQSGSHLGAISESESVRGRRRRWILGDEGEMSARRVARR